MYWTSDPIFRQVLIELRPSNENTYRGHEIIGNRYSKADLRIHFVHRGMIIDVLMTNEHIQKLIDTARSMRVPIPPCHLTPMDVDHYLIIMYRIINSHSNYSRYSSEPDMNQRSKRSGLFDNDDDDEETLYERMFGKGYRGFGNAESFKKSSDFKRFWEEMQNDLNKERNWKGQDDAYSKFDEFMRSKRPSEPKQQPKMPTDEDLFAGRRSNVTREQYLLVLELTPTATAADIKLRYRRMAARWHPDANPSNTQEASRMMQRINAAYAALTK